jgi:hypothetical protein
MTLAAAYSGKVISTAERLVLHESWHISGTGVRQPLNSIALYVATDGGQSATPTRSQRLFEVEVFPG